MTASDETLRVGRAALAEAGVDPHHLNRRDDRLYISHSVPLDTKWRAFEIMRQSKGANQCCLRCFETWVADGEDRSIVDNCTSTRIFDTDCGLYEVAP